MNLCIECAWPHPPDKPHLATSKVYREKFLLKHGRLPTWVDAMLHCNKKTIAFWRALLKKQGVNIDHGDVFPPAKEESDESQS